MHAGSEKESSSGAMRMMGPNLACALKTARERLPESSVRVSHLLVIAARGGPGMWRMGEKQRL